MFGIAPPWYQNEAFAFNMYAIAQEEKEDRLRDFGLALRNSSTPCDLSTQRQLCEEIVGCDLDDLTDYEIKVVEQVVNS